MEKMEPPNTHFVPLINSELVAIIDEEDWPRVSQHNWYFNNGYAQTAIQKKTILLHRFVMNAPEGIEVDHENRVKLDNRKSNLRLATRAQNAANQPKRTGQNTSQYKGVSWHKTANKWCAAIRDHGRLQHLGYFINEEDAARAYDQAAARIQREFACPNFPVVHIETLNLTVNLPPQ